MSTGRAPSTRKAVPFTIAVIGCGPRGISVLERIAARLANERNASPVIGDICIYVVDAHEIGGGRIWRPDQPSWLLMNTPAKETTIFSGPPDGGDVRPMAGPSLAEWWAEVDSGNAEPNGLAPRYVYGKYLKFAFDRIINDLSRHADVRVIRGAVIDVQKSDRRRTVMLSDRSTFDADKVVLATGHPVPELSASQLEFSLFARQHPGLRYIEGNSAADMQLSAIQPGERVGVIGVASRSTTLWPASPRGVAVGTKLQLMAIWSTFRAARSREFMPDRVAEFRFRLAPRMKKPLTINTRHGCSPSRECSRFDWLEWQPNWISVGTSFRGSRARCNWSISHAFSGRPEVECMRVDLSMRP